MLTWQKQKMDKMSQKLSIKYVNIFLLFVLLFPGCFPPSRFSHSIDVTSPDGKTNLKVSSVSWHGIGVIGPEPPRIVSCRGYISGNSWLKRNWFKINIDVDFKYSSSALNKIDVLWSPDSKYFAVSTPVDVSIYTKDGKQSGKYVLGDKQRASSLHWSTNVENLLFVVVKESNLSLEDHEDYFRPIALKLLSSKPHENKWKSIYHYNFKGNKFDNNSIFFESFIPNTVSSTKFGSEYREISPDTKYLLFLDDNTIQYYDLDSGEIKKLFEVPDTLSWVWWLSDTCILFDFYLLHSTGQTQQIIYNLDTKQTRDITDIFSSITFQDKKKNQWYKSLNHACNKSL